MKKIILLVFAIGFFVSLTSVSAVTLNLINGADRESVQFDKSLLYKKELNMTADKVLLKILDAPNKTVENVLVYLCKNSNPEDCLNKKPIKYRKTVNTEFLKTDVLENDKGSILIFVELKSGDKSGWFSDIFSIDRSQFLNSENYQVDVDLKTNLNDTKSLLFNTGMIPYNFINSIQFKGKSFYQLSGIENKESFIGKKTLNFTYSKLENSVKNIEGYSFIFPIGQDALSPISIYNLKEKCGDAVCGLGESYNTCWSDCRCPVGQVPGSKGCSSDAIKIVVDTPPQTIECISNDEVCGPLPSNFTLKFHLENAPIDYRQTQHFKLGNKPFIGELCRPDTPPRIEKLDKGLFLYVNNATSYTCDAPPVLINNSDIGELVFSIYLSLSYKTQNGTEFKEAAGQTKITYRDVTAEARAQLRSLQEKLDDVKNVPRDVKHVMEGVKAISYVMQAVSVGTCACCAAPFCGWGAACSSCSVSVKTTLITEGIFQLLKLGLAECTGVYNPTVFNIPVGDTEIIEGGTGRELASQVSSTCRKVKRFQDLMRQYVGEAEEKQKIDLKNHVQNLVWVNGEKSGYATGYLCEKEKAEIYYTFDQFECKKDLWLSMTPDRPVCECSINRFTKPNPLGDACNCFENTTSYSWIIDNSTGKPFGRQKYNTTDFHLLYNSTADLLFTSSRKDLNITLYCESDIYKTISDTLPLVSYKQTCGVAANQTGVSIFNPNPTTGASII